MAPRASRKIHYERSDLGTKSIHTDGAIFYIPSTNVPGTAPLYRLYNPGVPDHLDSLQAGESGYQTEGLLGYAYTSPNALASLWQFIRVSDGVYHATTRVFETLPGYSNPGGLSAWGISRYGTASLSLLSLSGGGVTIQSNGVAGGSLWSWTYNGVQYVNSVDYGREIQSSIFYNSTSGTQNPTEAGVQSPMALTNFLVEIPAVYLQKNFNTYYTYDSVSQAFSNVGCNLSQCNTQYTYSYTPPSGYGGVILSDSAGNNAMGAYGAITSVGGSVSSFSLWNLTCYNTTKIDVVYGPSITIPAGNSQYKSYLVSGTLTQVKQTMTALYQAGVK